MEKYNVVLDDEKTKTGATTKHCPQCGKDLSSQLEPNRELEVLPLWYCPNCGTEPFEKKPEPTK